jgi:hypothetical protein
MFNEYVAVTLSQQEQMRLYRPSDGDELAHKVDDAFFAANPERRFAIRESLSGEFDSGHKLPQAQRFAMAYDSRPALWVLVLSSNNGTYRVLPVYRGPHFFPVICDYHGVFAQCFNDAACLALLDEIHMLGGADAESWKAWQRTCCAAFTQVSDAQ